MTKIVLKKSLKLDLIESATKEAFTKVKAELDEHLDAININTTENKETYNRVRALEDKVDKLSEKFDQILEKIGEEKTFTIPELTLREQEVFIAIYTCSEFELCSVRSMSYKTGLPVKMVEDIVSMIIEKGIPLTKDIVDGEVSYVLDSDFKEMQTKSNVLKLNKDMMRHIASVNV